MSTSSKLSNDHLQYNDEDSLLMIPLNGDQNDFNNNNNNNDFETKTYNLRPVINGLYMLPLTSLKLFKEDIISLLSIQNIFLVSYSDEARNMNIDFINELNVSYQASNVETICVHIPLSYDENGKFFKSSNNAPMTISDISLCFKEFNDTLKDLMDMKKRALLIFSEQDYDILIAMTASFMVQFCYMCMDAALKHICDVIKYPRVFVKSVWYNHLNIYRRFVLFNGNLEISCQQNARYRYEFFLNYVKKNKLDLLDSEEAKHKTLRNLLIEYANITHLNEDEDLELQPSSHYCLNCHNFLFTDQNVLQTADPMGKHFQVNSQKCKTIFIEPVKWMFRDEEDCIRSQIIYCPGCNHPIGCYSFRGIHCSFSLDGDVCLIHPDLESRIFRIDSQLIYRKYSFDISKLFNKKLPCLNDSLEKNETKMFTDPKLLMKYQRMKLLNCRYGDIKTVPSQSIAVRKILINPFKFQSYPISFNDEIESENLLKETLRDNVEEQFSNFSTDFLLSTKDKINNQKIKNYSSQANRIDKKLERDQQLGQSNSLKIFIKKIFKNGIKNIDTIAETNLNFVSKNNWLAFVKEYTSLPASESLFLSFDDQTIDNSMKMDSDSSLPNQIYPDDLDTHFYNQHYKQFYFKNGLNSHSSSNNYLGATQVISS